MVVTSEFGLLAKTKFEKNADIRRANIKFLLLKIFIVKIFVKNLLKVIVYIIYIYYIKQVGTFEKLSHKYRTIMKNQRCNHMPETIKDCPVEYAMKIIGGKWKPILIFRIYNNINRFGMLSNNINEISKNMLTKQLRELEKDKIITRKIYPEIPPRVEYSLTKRGESLLPILESICEWGTNHEL